MLGILGLRPRTLSDQLKLKLPQLNSFVELTMTGNGPRGSVFENVNAVVIMMPVIANAVVARNQSSVFAKRDLMARLHPPGSGRIGNPRLEWS